MTLNVSGEAPSPSISAAWPAIISGVFGITAFGFIVAALFVREDSGRHMADLMFRCHDVAAMLQAFFMTYVVAGIYVFGSGAGTDRKE